MFIVTILFLLLSFFINYKAYRSDFIAPACVFSFALLVPALYALFWYDLWELGEYSVKCFLVIFLAVFTFSLFSRITFCSLKGDMILKKNCNYDKKNTIDTTVQINSGKGKLVFLLFLEFCTLKLALDFFHSYGSNLASAIIAYRVDFVNGGERMPKILSTLLNLSMVSSYYSAYIFINNLLCARKLELGWGIAFLGGILLSLFGGSRGGAVSIIFVAAGIFYVIYNHNPRKQSELKMRKKFIKILIVGIIGGFVFFVASASWIGRTNDFSPFYYFAIYLSAPLKNLDLYIQRIDFGQKLGFMEVNGASLGNVGTVLAFEYQLGGFFSVFTISALSSVLYTFIYLYMRRWFYTSHKINFSVIIYSYIFYSLCIVMFGATSFTSVFSLFFIKILLALIFLNYFFNLSFRAKKMKWYLGKTQTIFCLNGRLK